MSFQDEHLNSGSSSGYYENSRSSFSMPKNSGCATQSKDMRFSTLEPTAQEFYPSDLSNSQSGAIKKKSQNNTKSSGRGGRSRYGTGRTFSGHRGDYYEYGNTYSGEDQGMNNSSTKHYVRKSYRENRYAESSSYSQDNYNEHQSYSNHDVYKAQNQSNRPQSSSQAHPNSYGYSRRNDYEKGQSYKGDIPEVSLDNFHNSNGSKNYKKQDKRRYEKPRNNLDEYSNSNVKGRSIYLEHQKYKDEPNNLYNRECQDAPENTQTVKVKNSVSNSNWTKNFIPQNNRRHNEENFVKPMKNKYNEKDNLADSRNDVSNPNEAKNYNFQNYTRHDRNYEKPGKSTPDNNERINVKYDGGLRAKNNYDKYSHNGNNDFKDMQTADNGYRSRNFNDYSETSKIKKPSDYRRTDVNKYYERYQKHDHEGQPPDWRKSNVSKSNTSAKKYNKRMDAASQRERLEEMLTHRTLECLVCCEKIKHSDRVWSCMLCYNILHLHCVASWAKSSKVEENWRCPACQNVCNEIPRKYKCYCGKTVEPRFDPGAGTIPHGCGEMCLRKGRNCEHKCTLLCHPGPCPDCIIMVAKECGCGTTKPIVKCSTDIEIVCEAICDKLLECGLHNCQLTCHSGGCGLCEKMIIQECYCGKQGRKVPCRLEYNGRVQYECGDVCGKMLACGNHKCELVCHEGPCGTCVRDIEVVHTCPCGKNELKEKRVSCLDPIPCCDKLCGKSLKCGQPSSPHKCEQYCHEGDCPPCPLTTLVRCRCGHMDKEIPCQKLTTKADDARCEKKCTKKRLCGKHKCNQRCCIEVDHACPLPCGRQLACGRHRCALTCHSGRCPPCAEASFEELACECGAAVLFPPVACGTRPPACGEPCSRQRQCGHEPNHACHQGACPPCTVLCKRWCHGRHEQRPAIPCHQEAFGCGRACGAPAPCGRHRCARPCHAAGGCPSTCELPCAAPRAACGHPCARPCHAGACPGGGCTHAVRVECQCGVQKATRPCIEVEGEFRNLQMSQMKDKMGELSNNQSVNISDISTALKMPAVLKILECTEECRVLERNRRLAIGLQIRNPDLSQKLTPRYSDFMRQWAKKDPHFCQRVHDKLTDLVQLAKASKQKSRAYSFESMNRDKRHFVHEYCEHFGVESAAYDSEPNRNVVATALKDRSWLPGAGLLEVVRRESGQRKVPGPVLGDSSGSGRRETVSLRLPGRPPKAGSPPADAVDPFS